MATAIFSRRLIALSALVAALAPAAAFCRDVPGTLMYAGRSASMDAVPEKPLNRDEAPESLATVPELPASLCELVGGMSTLNRPANIPALLEGGSGPIGTAVGYDLGEGVRLQGVGVYDPGDNHASLGPAFKLNLEKGLAITTGMQLPVASDGPERHSGLFFAEFMFQF